MGSLCPASACNSVIPRGSGLASIWLLSPQGSWPWEEGSWLFPGSCGSSRWLYWTAFFTDTVALHLVLIWRKSSLLLKELLGLGFSSCDHAQGCPESPVLVHWFSLVSREWVTAPWALLDYTPVSPAKGREPPWGPRMCWHAGINQTTHPVKSILQ